VGIASSWPVRRRLLARLCAWLAVAAFAAAMARPSMSVEPTSRTGMLELVVDVSGSTNAGDLVPTRLGAMQLATVHLVEQLSPRVRVGLVSFSSSAASLARPTTNRAVVEQRIATLTASGPTALGDGLQQALNDIEASRPTAPAWVLLLSDGANTLGMSPAEAARRAATLHVPVLAVGVGRPDALIPVPDDTGALRLVPVPPDLVMLSGIATATGGQAVAARSAAELDEALADLVRRTGLAGGQRDLTLPFAAAALLLLAISRTLAPSRRGATAEAGARRPATARRWTAPAALLAFAGVAVVVWAQWVPVVPVGATEDAPAVRQAARALRQAPLPTPTTLPPPEPVEIDGAATRADAAVIRQATAVLRGQGMLATQRDAEIRRRHLTRIGPLSVTACDVCQAGSLSGPDSELPSTADRPSCRVLLNTPFIRQRARTAQVPLRMLVAMVLLHGQEVCLRNRDSTILPFDAEWRLASKLHNPRLFDLIYAQVDAGERDWTAVERGVAIVREHGELGPQRGDDLRRRRLNQVGPLAITVCHNCRTDRIGEAFAGQAVAGAVDCQILLDRSGIERNANRNGLPVSLVMASTLVHEQEHCVRDPDDRELPAVDQEQRLACKVGDVTLLDWVNSEYAELDSAGYWKD
jgi:Ca-activated chloride channel homolog